MQYAAGIAAQHRDDMVNVNLRVDTEANLQAQHDRLKLVEDGMDGLSAKAGGVETPQFNAWALERQHLQEGLQNNPLAKYNPELRKVDDEIFNRRLSLTGNIGAARDRYKATGNLAEAMDWFEKAVDGLKLSEKEKLSAEGEIRSHLWGMDAVRRQSNEEARSVGDALIYESKSTGAVDPTRFEQTARDLDGRRLYAKAAEVRGQAILQGATPVLLGGTGQAAVNALGQIRSMVGSATGAGGGPISLSPSDRDLAIRTIYGEAGNEPATGQAAVAHVIKNRVLSGQYGGTVAGTILAPAQFSVWNPGDPAGTTARNLSPDSPAYQRIGQIVDGVVAGKIPDPTRGASNYYNPSAASPAWGPGLSNVTQIGQHRFGNTGPGAGRPAAASAFVIGDSLGDGIRNATGAPGITTAGRQPGDVLNDINGLAPQQLAGRTVVLSGGASNDPKNAGIVAQQIQALQAKGVDPFNIRIVGVGDRSDFRDNGVNAKLQTIARQAGAQFVAVDPSTLGPDRVHPVGYGSLAASARGQGASVASGMGDTAPAWQMVVKQSQDTFNAHAERLWNHVSYALDKGYAPTPDESADLKTMAPFVTKTDLLSKMQDGLSKLQTGAAIKGLTLVQQQDLATTMQTLATGGQLDNLGRHVAANLQGEVEHRVTLAKDQPVLYGQRYIAPDARASLPEIAPLDLSSPQALAAGLQARQKMKGAAQQGDPMVGSNVLTPSDQNQITATLQRGDPQQAATLLSGLRANLKPEELAAVLSDKGGLKESLVGMARSSDPAKMNAAFGFLDAQERANPRLFAAQFGEVSPDLTRWQNLLRWMPADEVPKVMQKYNDPTQRRR